MELGIGIMTKETMKMSLEAMDNEMLKNLEEMIKEEKNKRKEQIATEIASEMNRLFGLALRNGIRIAKGNYELMGLECYSGEGVIKFY